MSPAARPPLAPSLALLASLFACTDTQPRITEAWLLHETDDPRGPYRVSARVAGGDGALRVRLRVSTDGPAALEGECAAGEPARGVWRGVDGGVATEAQPGCHAIVLALRGGRHVGTFSAPPYELGTRLHYRLVATDADGDRAEWPARGPGSVQIGPPGNAPGLVGLAPASGPLAGGTEVLIRGEGFADDLEIRFGARRAETQVVSRHLARALVPAGEAGGPVDVVATRRGRSARLPGAFAYVPPPRVDALSPDHGPTGAETLVVLDGGGFVEGATVRFGDVEPAPADWLSATRITAVAPPHPPATVEVEVVNPDGQSTLNPQAFTWWPPPALDAIEPGRGPDGGGTVATLSGADLRSPGAVYFGDRPALDVEVAPDGRSATLRTPIHPEGAVDVVWFNPDGQLATLERAFRFQGPPFVDEARPPVVSRCGGGVTVLVGRNLDPEMRVRFDGVEGEVLSVNDEGTEARVRAPPGAPGPVVVEVSNPDGRGWRADDLLVYGVQPVVRTVAPARVPVWGGVNVVIEGADFEDGAIASFGGVEAELTAVERAGCDARILARVPPNEAGPADVRVENPDGAAGEAEDAVEYVEPALDPPHGLVPGYANLTLTGVDLRRGLRVLIGGRPPRAATQISEEVWTLVTDEGIRGPADLEVRNLDGRGAALEGAFTYRVFVESPEGLDAPGDCNDARAADLDGDGDLDVVTANGSVGMVGQIEQPPAIFFNEGGRLRRVALQPARNGMNAPVGDYDGDGDLDILVANLSSNRNTLFRNDGRGGFSEVRGFVGAGPSYDAEWVDVDRDGDLDAFLLQTGDSDGGNASSGPERLYLNDGRGNFRDVSERVGFDVRDVHDHDVAFGDLNGDGLPDAVIVVDNLSQSFATARNRLLLNRGGGRLEIVDSPLNDFLGDWLHAELSDLDADGDLDVLLPQDYIEGISRRGTPPIAVFLNDGDANFVEANDRIRGLPELPAFGTEVVDLDGDGDVDIALAVYGILYGDGTIEAFASLPLLNDGTATFFAAPGAFAERPRIATADYAPFDVDGDGDLDLFDCAARGETRLWVQD